MSGGKLIASLACALRPHDLPLRIALWDGQAFDLGRAPKATIHVKSEAGVRRLVRPSLDRLGEAYVEGELDAEGDLGALIDATVGLVRHFGTMRPGWLDIFRRTNHSRTVDAESIAYHYDVSNDFYRLWLDRDMVYSCAYFRDEGDSLEQAQHQKIDHVLRKIRLEPGHRLLDIGCGWGALILRAARDYGARALGITLSKSQYELARQRIAEAGLEDRCEVRLADYRDLTGCFDRVTSIGMFEHVGLKNLRAYFSRIHELLDDDGIALNHGITAGDPESREVGWGGGSFIDRYVFPHGELPHIGLALKEMSAAGLEAMDIENLRHHYTLTLRQWAQRFEAAGESVREIAGDRRYRIWRLYLTGCAYAFAHGWTAIHQVLAVKAARPHPDLVPLTRDYMYAASNGDQ